MKNKQDIINISTPVTHFTIGVYFLLHENEIVYIGQTKFGLSRVFNHVKNKIFDKYSFIECGIDELNQLESAYIIKYNPKYNKAINKGSKSVNALKSFLHKMGVDNKYHDKRYLKSLITELGYKIEIFMNQDYMSEECYLEICKILMKDII